MAYVRRLSVIIGAGLLAAASMQTCAAKARVTVGSPRADVRLGPTDLGGITRIFRYVVAQPDRTEIAYLFLAEPSAPGQAPMQVQVIGKGGEELHLSDTQGADCTLEHVWIRTKKEGGPEVVYAARTFSGDLKTDSASEPAPMDVSVFRLHPGEDAGDSEVVLRLHGAIKRSRPVCRVNDVQREMVRLARSGRDTSR